MATLPSYQDAISRLDWLGLVASYVEDKDLASLCSVNRRFYAVFAARLWNDPLVAVRRLGLDPSDDLEWYLTFVFDRMPCMRMSTLALVTTLDFRDFAKDIAHFSSDNSTRTIPETLRILPRILPNLRCILLDGHVEADPAFLTATPPSEAGTAPSDRSQGVLALSVAHCQTQLPNGFFSSDRLQYLVYLDVSGLPGSLQPLVVAAQGRRTLNRLKVLKARRREINDALALALFKAFKSSLWSLDIGGNNITDRILDQFATLCFNSPSLRSQSRFPTEGKLVFDGQGNDAYGRFMSIQESDWSGTFTHPERHFVDAPAYCADASRVLQEDEAVRTNGRTPLRRDSVDYAKAAIAGSMDQPVPDWSDVPYLDVCTAPAGITHLHLSDNRVTTSGLERLIRSSQGQLEELSCDSPLFQPIHRSAAAAKQHFRWPGNIKLRGALGCAHVFRPVVSSNLRVLRIHHSLVTQIPTLEADGLSTMARLWLAETAIRERSERAFPPAFEPDMNPRLTSLTLTKIPRRSIGPLIDKLLHFLKLMGLQEYAIQGTAHSLSRRSPVLLRGLRHLHLEFEADPIEDPTGFSTVEDLDAEGLMNMDSGEGFSFFGDERPRSRTSAEAASKKQATEGDGLSVRHPKVTAGRLAGFPYSEVDAEHMRYIDTWGERQTNREVWVGTGIPGTNHAINEYMKLVLHPSLRSRVGPATPAHVKAGVPEGALLFHAAWDAIVMPLELKPPRTTELHGMRDVLEAVKKFRVETRAHCETAKRVAVEGMAEPTRPRHVFWTGRLEVSAQQSMAHYRAPRYWR
ncbi:leucine rich repeat domain containing protein [Colletotrichum tofieldiae]|nr:leucine rich repeat domain containing protein [Colletotrichum tofieldiae]